MNLDVFEKAVAQVIVGARMAATDLRNIDPDVSLEESLIRGAEAFVDALRIDNKEALSLLLCCEILPSESTVLRVTPGLTPGYLAGLRKAAEVCLIQAAVARIKEAS